MNAEIMKRQIAYKLRIGDLLAGKPIIENQDTENARFSFLELGNRNIVRVNVIANVTEKFISEGEKKFSSITLDDASGQIRVKAFGEDTNKMNNIIEGNTIRVIGMLRYFNNEVYILPEIIKQVDPRYLLVRKLEIESSQPKQEVSKEQVKALKDQILEIIKQAEPEQGIDVDKIIMQLKSSPDLINQEITKFLEEGIIYEPRPGRLRYLG